MFHCRIFYRCILELNWRLGGAIIADMKNQFRALEMWAKDKVLCIAYSFVCSYRHMIGARECGVSSEEISESEKAFAWWGSWKVCEVESSVVLISHLCRGFIVVENV